ncbi:hypothetical protein EBH_0079940 [Eimeria brunetti]|uniref:RNA-directed DNA polymerase n=1 Tax=Eimeria brunetti TaxID=51314 RepID=U6LVD4_9EIME|nr:hypothetical protein EBH_0079940 [Eimeria brunetti]
MQTKLTGGNVCLVATGPNAISVSPNWRRRILPEWKPNTPEEDIGRTPRAAEGTDAPSRTGDEGTGNDQGGIGNPARKPTRKAAQQKAPQRNEEEGAADLPWWHEGTAPERTHEYYESLCGTGKTAVLQLEIVGQECEGLLDTGTSHSFIRPAAVEQLGLRVRIIHEACSFTVANGEVLRIDRIVPRLSMLCGGECFTGDFLHYQAAIREPDAKSAATAAPAADDTEDSPWPTAKLTYTEFGNWSRGHDALRLPPQMLTVLQQHRLLFPDSLPDGLPPKRPYDHRILLLPGKLPTKAPIYKMPPDHLSYHTKEIVRLTAKGWVGPTYSPICAPTIMVDKHDDGSGERKMRMVVNYQALNTLTIAPEFPMPSVHTILEMLGGATYFSTLDLEAGFHQIRMAKEDRWKTAFRSVQGLFKYKVMPFGLKGAPATFQANINAYLQPPLGHGVITYLDDVLIYSPSLGAAGIKPSADKVEAILLWPDVPSTEAQVRQFLGTVSYCRMFMGPRYADTARPLVELTRKGIPFAWGSSHTTAVRQLKRLLAEYTTLQVPDSTRPYTLYTDASGYAVGAVLEQDGKPVGFLSQVMSPAQQGYSIYDQELLALVTTLDKWHHLLRGTKVKAYTDHQALTYLQPMNAQKPLRRRTARWLDFLAEFPDLTITSLHGTRNRIADALSHHPQHVPADPTTPVISSLTPVSSCDVPPTARYSTRAKSRDFRAEAGLRPSRPRQTVPSTTPPLSPADPAPPSLSPAPSADIPADAPDPASPPLDLPPPPEPSEPPPVRPSGADPLTPQRWEAAYPLCPHFREAFSAARQRDGEEVSHELLGRRYTFRFRSPHLHICINGLWPICVPTLPEFLPHVVYRHHDHVTPGHRGQKKTFLSLSKLYYWPGIRAYTTAYVESSVQCRGSKALSQKPAGLLQPVLVPSSRWSHVSLDFITDLPPTPRGHDSILVIVDSLSKMAHFIPTKKTASAADTVELFADRLIRYRGFPDVLISDRDPRFQSLLWQQLCHRLHIKRAISSAYHPQSDGQTERVNRTLEQMLRTYIQTDEREWERLLPALEFAYNTTSHSFTELIPIEVMIGQNPLTAADLGVVGNLAPTLTPPVTKLFRQLCDRAQSHILKAKWHQKMRADARRRGVQYNPGELVWVSSCNLRGLNQCSKFELRFRGPFSVVERIGQVAYRVALPPTYTCHNVSHVSHLVPDRPRDPQITSKEAAVGWRPLTEQPGSPTDLYEADYILTEQPGSPTDLYEADYILSQRGTGAALSTCGSRR